MNNLYLLYKINYLIAFAASDPLLEKNLRNKPMLMYRKSLHIHLYLFPASDFHLYAFYTAATATPPHLSSYSRLFASTLPNPHSSDKVKKPRSECG